MLASLAIASAILGMIAFFIYPRCPRSTHGVLIALGLIGVLGLYLLMLAPNDYLLRLPDLLTTIFHPYLVALWTLSAILIFAGISAGAFTSCIYNKTAKYKGV